MKGWILVLNSRHGWKPAMLLNSAGQKELACFERDDTTEAYGSCSINWKNKLFIFGGKDNARQISRLTGQKLERVGSLDFDHVLGACSIMKTKFIYLCFSYGGGYSSDIPDEWRRCRRSTGPLQPFPLIAMSNHGHGQIQTSTSDSKLKRQFQLCT